MEKVAKLVAVSLVTRVEVPENATEEEVKEAALPGLRKKLNDEFFDNLEFIELDKEHPYESTEENSSPLQFRRNNSNGSLTRGHGVWEDMPEKGSWEFVRQFLPNYDRRDDVATSDDLSCVICGEKTLMWLYKLHPEWKGLSIEELKEVRKRWDGELAQEAERYFDAAIKSLDIEISRPFFGSVCD